MPGTYVAFVKIDFDKKFEKDFEVTLAIYSEFACGIHIASQLDAIEFSGNSEIDWNNKYPQMVRRSSEHYGKCCSFH